MGESSFIEGDIVSFTTGADEGVAEGFTPVCAHGFAGMAAIALADAVSVEDGTADFSEFFFVNPGLAHGHDITAVVEHEAVAVRVTKVIKGGDGARRVVIHGANSGGATIDPDEFDVSFGCVFSDPLSVGFFIFPSPEDVARFVDDPGDFCAFIISAADFFRS